MFRPWLLIVASLLFLLITANALWVSAQGEVTPTPQGTVVNAAECSTPLGGFWLTASDACVGKNFGFICNGGISPTVEPIGPVSNSLAGVGALVDIKVVDSIHTPALAPRGENGGIAWLRVAAEDSPLRFSAVLIGDVSVRDTTPDGFPAWQNFVVKTTDPLDRCEIAPHSSFIVQSLPGQPSRVVINGVSLDLSGTAVIQTEENITHFMAIVGDLGMLINGQRTSVSAGNEIAVAYDVTDFSRPNGTMSLPAPFRRDRVDHLPVLLFDLPIFVPQGGFATTQGQVNMRTEPNLDAAVIVQVGGGERMTVLGRNPEGNWYHVRLSNGQTGWMFAELLTGNLTEVEDVYIETPQPLQRMGDLGQKARVIAPNGVTMRVAPDLSFAPVGTLSFQQEVTLIARSPYSPWVKVDLNGLIGWVALITLETAAIIEALPVDYNVPPPPEPTRIPGSFGNAFPDPNCYPNCG